MDKLCVARGGETGSLFVKDGYWIRGCAVCGHRLAELDAGPEHTARVYADDYFAGGCSNAMRRRGRFWTWARRRALWRKVYRTKAGRLRA
jgi:hypothetical protein